MIIKYKLAKLRVSKNQEEKIKKYLNADRNDLYYVEGMKHNCFNINKKYLIENKINYCKNTLGYLLVTYKNGYIVTKDFLNVFNILENLKKHSK